MATQIESIDSIDLDDQSHNSWFNDDMIHTSPCQLEPCKPTSSSCWYNDESDSSEEEDLASLTSATVRKRLFSQGSVDTLDTALTEGSQHSHADDEWSSGYWLKEAKVHFSSNSPTILEYEPPAKENFSDLFYSADELLDFREAFQSELIADMEETDEDSY